MTGRCAFRLSMRQGHVNNCHFGRIIFIIIITKNFKIAGFAYGAYISSCNAERVLLGRYPCFVVTWGGIHVVLSRGAVSMLCCHVGRYPCFVVTWGGIHVLLSRGAVSVFCCNVGRYPCFVVSTARFPNCLYNTILLPLIQS